MYGVPLSDREADPQLLERRRQLITQAADTLDDHKVGMASESCSTRRSGMQQALSIYYFTKMHQLWDRECVCTVASRDEVWHCWAGRVPRASCW